MIRVIQAVVGFLMIALPATILVYVYHDASVRDIFREYNLYTVTIYALIATAGALLVRRSLAKR